jgi:hypothetical protein
MGDFYILGASGRRIWPYDCDGNPDEWLKCQIRMKEYEDGKKVVKTHQETQTRHPRQEVGQTLFGRDSQAG